MRVAEKFISINGESSRAGELAVFIRFQGCNLRCSYYDTMWANEETCPFEEMTPREIGEYVCSTGIKNVTLTGGEPLLQEDMEELIAILIRDCGVRVEIETNGSVDLGRFTSIRYKGKIVRPVFTLDYKLKTSGCEDQMDLGNYKYLVKEDTVKFVAGSRSDLENAAEIIGRYGLADRCNVYISPIFGKIEPADIVDYMTENKLNGVRLQIQMHKVIWNPDMKGV